MKKSLLVGTVLLLAGCATGPVDPGPRPANWRNQIDQNLQLTLKDPDSIKDFRVTAPLQPASHFLYGTGWAACIAFNAKNSYGAYGGLKEYVAMFQKEGSLSVTEDSFNLCRK